MNVLIMITILAAEGPLGYACPRAMEPPSIDGRLDDPTWTAAHWTSDFVDIEGSKRPSPRFRTRAKMLWDDRFFYIAAEMEEPHVWATLRDHDSVIFHDNDFEVFLDPDSDNHAYFEFEINAYNTGWDLFLPRPYRDGGPPINAWEISGLKTAVHIDGTIDDPTDRDRGWSVEIAIPWAALADHAGTACPPRPGDLWRVSFSRVEWQVEVADGRYRKVPETREDNWVWSPQWVVDMHRPERWGHVVFTEERPAPDSPLTDPDQPARDLLMAVYQAQHAYRRDEGDWADTLDLLDNPELRAARARADSWKLSLSLTADGGFEAAATGPGGRLCVREDSRLVREPAGPGVQAGPTGR